MKTLRIGLIGPLNITCLSSYSFLAQQFFHKLIVEKKNVIPWERLIRTGYIWFRFKDYFLKTKFGLITEWCNGSNLLLFKGISRSICFDKTNQVTCIGNIFIFWNVRIYISRWFLKIIPQRPPNLIFNRSKF